jgi:hypothetical protein
MDAAELNFGNAFQITNKRLTNYFNNISVAFIPVGSSIVFL